jgi:ubiquinone/menaquinone biosynthesis C-methylase UbiE
MDKRLLNMKSFREHGNDHDFFTKDHAASFLRNHNTGTNNLGRKYLAHILQKYDNPKVLDVACGSAVNFEVFKSLNVQHQYTGFDLTQGLLNEAKDRYGNEVHLVQGYAQELEKYFTPNSFDVVIIRHFLEHVFNGNYHSILDQAMTIASKEVDVVFFLVPHNDPEDKIEERSSGIDGHPEITHFWNHYSWEKFCNYVNQFGFKMKAELIATPYAAHPDFIVRIIK